MDNILKPIQVLTLTAVGFLLFSGESVGINLTLGFLAFLLLLMPLAKKQPNLKIPLLLLLIAGLTPMINGNGIQIPLFLICLAFIHGERKAVFTLGIFKTVDGFNHWLFTPGFIATSTANLIRSIFHKRPDKHVIIPVILIAFPFLIFYFVGNAAFQDATQWLITNLKSILYFINVEQALILLAFIILSTGFVYAPGAINPQIETLFPVVITRKKQIRPTQTADYIPTSYIGMIDLKKERKVAIYSFSILTILLAFNNILEFWSILQASITPLPSAYTNLYKNVHNGTLILSISLLLGSGLVLYFFRNNLHFFSNKTLKQRAYFWLIGNVILCALLAFRNVEYIQFYGLTYKRLGVFLFLIMMSAGIIFIAIKIHRCETLFQVAKKCLYTLFITMVLAASIPWDLLITRVNLSQKHKAKADLAYLFDLGDNALPELIAHPELYNVPVECRSKNWHEDYRTMLERKIRSYEENNESHTIFSTTIMQKQIEQSIYKYNNNIHESN